MAGIYNGPSYKTLDIERVKDGLGTLIMYVKHLEELDIVADCTLKVNAGLKEIEKHLKNAETIIKEIYGV